jgi:hypothetical protein
MAVALEPTLEKGQLRNLVVADIAPSIGKLSSEFIAYVGAMKEIEAAKVKSRKEALQILNKVEKVRPFPSVFFPVSIQSLSRIPVFARSC